MTIAITGASGQFGRSATELLLESVPAQDLILISRSPAKLEDFAARGCVVRKGDFDDRSGLTDALRGADRMLMISGTRVGFREPQHTNAVEAAKAAGVSHIVYTSFIAANPSNPSMAVKDHVFTEALLSQSGLTWTALRDAQYSEAVRDAMAPMNIATGRMISLARNGKMAFVCREDCVASAVAVLLGEGHEGKVYNITGPELISYHQVSELLAEVSDRPVTFLDTDVDGLYAMFDAIGIPREPVDDLTVANFPWNSDDMVSFEVAVRDGYFAVISDDVERLTGRKPRSLRDLLHAHRDSILAAADAMGHPG
ncbi:MAG: NAD(P)-dependent oxidoreductase [Alphaproteobacteria bacterium]|nr:MAG: NAD(P)-dependent oxidoreductase [Alphaproteobacteria bacterium]PZO41612.1 MAG: NAD(P)-dependent oxidoreductase [Alphaproteobacteria bacterium]